MLTMRYLPLLLGLAHGVSATSFKTEGRKIMIQTPSGGWEVFKIRGFSYSNARIGEGAPSDTTPSSYDSLMRPDICKRDFDAMRKLNVNSIKVYAYNVLVPNSWALHKDCLDYAWNNGYKPIFVDLSIWIDSFPMSAEYKTDILTGYKKMVEDTAAHPAVFAYAIGSELSGDPNCPPTNDLVNCPYWQDFNAVASTIRQAMGSNQKLITTGTYQTDCTNPELCSTTVPCIGHVMNGEHAGADVDFWGVDIYSPDPGADYLRQAVFGATTKPLFLPEYGVTFQPSHAGTDLEKSQHEIQLARQMEQYSYDGSNDGNEGSQYDNSAPIYAGGLLFEWQDEYWKAPTSSPPCAASQSSSQGWWGKNAVQLKPGCQCVAPEERTAECAMDDLVPRPTLTDPSLLPSLWSTYVPSSWASGPSPTPPAPSPAPTPVPGGSWNPCGPGSVACCNPYTTPTQICTNNGLACQTCGGSSACECPQADSMITSMDGWMKEVSALAEHNMVV